MFKPVDVDTVLLFGFHKRVVDSDEDTGTTDASSTVDQQWTLIECPFITTQRRTCRLKCLIIIIIIIINNNNSNSNSNSI